MQVLTNSMSDWLLYLLTVSVLGLPERECRTGWAVAFQQFEVNRIQQKSKEDITNTVQSTNRDKGKKSKPEPFYQKVQMSLRIKEKEKIQKKTNHRLKPNFTETFQIELKKHYLTNCFQSKTLYWCLFFWSTSFNLKARIINRRINNPLFFQWDIKSSFIWIHLWLLSTSKWLEKGD